MSTQIQQPLPSTPAKKPSSGKVKTIKAVSERTEPKRHLFSVKDYHAMVRAGVLKEGDRVELIKGEIVEISPIGSLHAAYVNRLNALLAAKVSLKAIVSVQNPFESSAVSEPQPDIALLKYKKDFYKSQHPKAKDVLVVIEVADTSVGYDRDFKIPLYAQSKIAQAILVDLQADVVEVYSKPVKGAYARVQRLERGQKVTIQKLPAIKLRVDEILG